jgi:hypothetical protein
MLIYYMHLYNDTEAKDEEGVELDNLDAARVHASTQAVGLISETIKDTRRLVLSHRIDIEDCESRVLSTVRYGDAVTVVN